jgi:hypothetical protein
VKIRPRNRNPLDNPKPTSADGGTSRPRPRERERVRERASHRRQVECPLLRRRELGPRRASAAGHVAPPRRSTARGADPPPEAQIHRRERERGRPVAAAGREGVPATIAAMRRFAATGRACACTCRCCNSSPRGSARRIHCGDEGKRGSQRGRGLARRRGRRGRPSGRLVGAGLRADW